MRGRRFALSLAAVAGLVLSGTAATSAGASSIVQLNGQLTAVTCWSASGCEAVGQAGPSGTLQAAAATWTGSQWRAQTVPEPKGATGGTLLGITCLTAKNCLAVGSYDATAGNLPLAEHWNGTSWSRQTTPATGTGTLFGIGCMTSSLCLAVGYTDTDRALAEVYQSGHWQLGRPYDPGRGYDTMTAVACPGRSGCYAVGTQRATEFGSGSALIEHWNGRGSWAVEKTPAAVTGDQVTMDGIACHSATSCLAVGSLFQGEAAADTSALRLVSGKWSVSKPVSPSTDKGDPASILGAVACPSATFCLADGYFNDSSGAPQALAEQFTKSWAVSRAANAKKVQGDKLGGIACVSATDCFAVGYSQASAAGGYSFLAERWTKGHWAVMSTPAG
jgi:hypothetical protein